MNKEVTLGQVLIIIFTLVTSMIGWGISVEVRLAQGKSERKSQIETIHSNNMLLTTLSEKLSDVAESTAKIEGFLEWQSTHSKIANK